MAILFVIAAIGGQRSTIWLVPNSLLMILMMVVAIVGHD
jgi:hypothetical protein